MRVPQAWHRSARRIRFWAAAQGFGKQREPVLQGQGLLRGPEPKGRGRSG